MFLPQTEVCLEASTTQSVLRAASLKTDTFLQATQFTLKSQLVPGLEK